MINKNELASKIGCIYEFAINLGFLAFLKGSPKIQRRTGQAWKGIELYFHQAEQINLKRDLIQPIFSSLSISEPDFRREITNQVEYAMLHGYLAGSSLARELFPRPEAIGYLQMNLMDIYGNQESSEKKQRRLHEMLEIFNLSASTDQLNANRLRQKGCFGNADFILYLPKSDIIYVIDYSMSHQQFHGLINDLGREQVFDFDTLESVDRMKRCLMANIVVEKQRNAWSRANLAQSHQNLSSSKSQNLSSSKSQNLSSSKKEVMGLLNMPKQYFHLVKQYDKELHKLIQASAYTHDFLDLTPQVSSAVAIGFTNRNHYSMSFQLRNEENQLRNEENQLRNEENQLRNEESKDRLILQQMAALYSQQEQNKINPQEYYLGTVKPLAKKQWGKELTKQFFRFFEKAFSPKQSGIWEEGFTETIQGFSNTADERDSHANAVLEALEFPLDSKAPTDFIVLSGNAGIGKTTTLMKYLNQLEQFACFYISPRIVVNEDFLEKAIPNKKKDLQKIAITTNSSLIRCGVDGVYDSDRIIKTDKQDQKDGYGCRLLHRTRDQELIEGLRPKKGQQHVAQSDYENRINERSQDGVIKKIHQLAKNSVIQHGYSKVVVSMASQGYLKGGSAPLTSMFERKQKSMAIEKPFNLEGKELIQFRQKVNHVVVFLDEITGSENGSKYFDHVMSKVVPQFKKAGFRIQVIVADASITNQALYQKHINTRDSREKIYLTEVSPQELEKGVYTSEISQRFGADKKAPELRGKFINVNSFPASELKIRYQLCFKNLPKKESVSSQNLAEDLKKSLSRKEESKEQTQIAFREIQQFLQDYESDAEAQLLIFLQNKQLAVEIQTGVISENWLSKEQILLINQEKRLEKGENFSNYKLMIVTSSASRGLTFQHVCRLLIFIPDFNLANNLMEIMQCIYRGRGGKRDRTLKELVFVFYQEKRIHSDYVALREKISLLSYLLLLKASILTRIQGGILIRDQHYAVVAVGGKKLQSAKHFSASTYKEFLDRAKQRAFQDTNAKRHLNLLEQILGGMELDIPKTQIFLYLEKVGGILKQNQNLSSLINLQYPELEGKTPVKFFVNGGMIFIQIPNEDQVHQTFFNSSRSIPRLKEVADFLEGYSFGEKHLNREKYKIVEFLRYLSQKIETSQKSQENRIEVYSDNLYCALLTPFSLLDPKIQKQFLLDRSGPSLKNLMCAYTKSVFPDATQFLPIGDFYRDLPFLLFFSSDLAEQFTETLNTQSLFNNTILNLMHFAFSE